MYSRADSCGLHGSHGQMGKTWALSPSIIRSGGPEARFRIWHLRLEVTRTGAAQNQLAKGSILLET